MNKPILCRKKPVEVLAIQWTGENLVAVADFVEKSLSVVNGEVKISTLEGVMSASKGDFIIRGVKGEFYPCKPDIFVETYEGV